MISAFNPHKEAAQTTSCIGYSLAHMFYTFTAFRLMLCFKN